MNGHSPFRRILAATLLPVFLIGALFCSCPEASATVDRANGHHSCCPDDKHHHGQPSEGHKSDCQHCNHAQSLETAKPKVPPANLALAYWIAPAVSVRLLNPPLAPLARPATSDAPPGRRSLLRHKCVLLI